MPDLPKVETISFAKGFKHDNPKRLPMLLSTNSELLLSTMSNITFRIIKIAVVLLFIVISNMSNLYADSLSLVKQIDWKLLFNQLFALEIKKQTLTLPAYQLDHFQTYYSQLREHTAWTPYRFNQVIDKVLQADTSSEAYQIRTKIYSDSNNYQRIASANFDLAIPSQILALPQIKHYLATIKQYQPSPSQQNFFDSEIGQATIQAITWQRYKQPPQKIALVIVPGYAGHLIQFPIFEEIIKDANQYYGREAQRPIIEEDGLDFTVEDYHNFYAQTNTPPYFDILHPAGALELGNTVGNNNALTQLLVQWLENLPEIYQNHQFILLGYSKGAAVILDVVRQSPKLRQRIAGFITYGGVIQGTNIARTGIDVMDQITQDKTWEQWLDQLQTKSNQQILDSISPLIQSLPISAWQLPLFREVFAIFDYDIDPIESILETLLQRDEVYALREGIVDMLPVNRAKWDLLYLNNHSFADNTFIFNLSAITDISSFAQPNGITRYGQKQASVIAPTLTDDGQLDWANFSLDSVFLYLSSIEGFKLAPAGLYDTQVELANTKMALLDTRPYHQSLTEQEIAQLWQQPQIQSRLYQQGIYSSQKFANTPRNQLFPKDMSNHIHAVDLGEIKGHHWSIMQQAFRPPMDISTDYAIWSFPRKAYIQALLQTLALYHLVLEYQN